MRFLSLTLVSAVVVAATATGCISSVEGSPLPEPGHDAPSSGTSDPGSDELPYAGAPAVTDPLDTALFQQDPCRALTSDQADTLKLRYPGTSRDGGLGKACEFRVRSDRLALVEVASLDENPYGVSAVYQAEKEGELAFFEPLDPVQGYPFVAYGALDERDSGACSVVIGVSDDIAFEVAVRQSAGNIGKKDPCDAGATVAKMVVETMKAAQ